MEWITEKAADFHFDGKSTAAVYLSTSSGQPFIFKYNTSYGQRNSFSSFSKNSVWILLAFHEWIFLFASYITNLKSLN